MRSIYLLAIIGLVACAEGEVPSADAGDAGVMTSNDMAVLPDSTTTSVPDVPSVCGVCCPGDRMCSDDVTSSSCKADGSGFEMSPCVGDETCTDGICTVAPVCQPGEKSCFDTTTVLTCRQTGDGFTTSPCVGETTCIDGACLSGSGLGAACTTDDECVTGNCHCDSAEGCPSSISTGYCTTQTCTFDSCGRDAMCFVAGVAPLNNVAADYDHCVPKCTVGSCPAGRECISVPVRTVDGVIWEQACYFSGFVGIGGKCTTDTQCIGGTCLKDYYSIGYCTRECSDDGICPDTAACVSLIPGKHHCSTLCGDGSVMSQAPCPFTTAEPLETQCKLFSDRDGFARKACYSP